MLIGRVKEQKILAEPFRAEESKFVAIYGRRRVGKTYLIRESMVSRFTFQHTGYYGGKMADELFEFCASLREYGLKDFDKPRNWLEALLSGSKKFMQNLDDKLSKEGVEAAKTLCRDTKGPVASICYQGLLRMNESADVVERSVSSYASVQVGKMEKGCSWITLCIAMAPSLGFLGTVIGMVMAFDQIQTAGDISPTIVAEGMKVALITTIFGIITALILQLFYNYVLSKIDHLTAQMEESAITLMDIISKK